MDTICKADFTSNRLYQDTAWIQSAKLPLYPVGYIKTQKQSALQSQLQFVPSTSAFSRRLSTYKLPIYVIAIAGAAPIFCRDP